MTRGELFRSSLCVYGVPKIAKKPAKLMTPVAENLHTLRVKKFNAFLWRKIHMMMHLITVNSLQVHATPSFKADLYFHQCVVIWDVIPKCRPETARLSSSREWSEWLIQDLWDCEMQFLLFLSADDDFLEVSLWQCSAAVSFRARNPHFYLWQNHQVNGL